SVAAMKRVIVTYHWVFAIIHATAPIVRKSAAARAMTPERKGLKTIFLHASIERRTREAECLGGPADVPPMRLESPQDRLLLQGIELRGFGREGGRLCAGRGVASRGEREVPRLEHRSFAENDGALDGVAQRAHVTRPPVGRQAIEGRRAQPLGRNVVFLRVNRYEVLEEQG